EVKLRGELDGAPVEIAAPVVAGEAAAGPAERIWAAARIAELEASADPAAAKEVVALSRRHHVLSRRTALLVLENDRMFAQFGIERTRAPAITEDPLPAGPAPAGHASMSLGSSASVSSHFAVGAPAYSMSGLSSAPARRS